MTPPATPLAAQAVLPVSDQITQAINRIAPAWPLDRAIAVNPWWGFVDQPFDQATAQLRRLADARTHMSPAWFRDCLADGRISMSALREALRAAGRNDDAEAFAARETLFDNGGKALLPLTHFLNERHPQPAPATWPDICLNTIGQVCALWFDRTQSSWRVPTAPSLYALWQEMAARDHGAGLLSGHSGLAGQFALLPDSPMVLIELALRELGILEHLTVDYLTALLFQVSGWASCCAYQHWQASIEGRSDQHRENLLAVRLAWELVLARAVATPAERDAWIALMQSPPAEDTGPSDREVWLMALERSWQHGLHAALATPPAATGGERASLQAVFCIDVRSEGMRRALEQQDPLIATQGFAGFFGLPLSFTPLGEPEARPQLPGLLAASMHATPQGRSPQITQLLASRRTARLAAGGSITRYKTSALGSFGFVEAMGLGYVWQLLRDSLHLHAPVNPDTAGLSATEAAQLRPLPDEAGVGQLVPLLAGVLSHLHLPKPMAPVVLLVGHASQSANNPLAATLDCGACCGQSGEVNARLLAELLNRADLRAALEQLGTGIPSDTVFVAGLHNTTTDEITLFHAPARLAPPQLQQLQNWLEAASQAARQERASRLGLAGQSPTALKDALSKRARDWSQVRPEWGLANNAGFIAAPRSRTRQLNLGGRCFLHEYDAGRDTGGKTLELILTAPVVVAHWINMQYYASVVDNFRWGSGNKLLHNVVGGSLGVFEGNGGDLRPGLPLQSLHDGKQWQHTPQRLAVWVEAAPRQILEIVNRHALLRNLVGGHWISLFCINPDSHVISELRLAADGQFHWQFPVLPVTPHPAGEH